MGMPSKFRIRISRNGGQSFRYFDTLDEALDYEHPQEYDFMGYRRQKPRITIQENVDGILNKYRSVEGLATITIRNCGKLRVKL